MADAGALAGDFPPAFFRSQIAEPEGEGPALLRPHRIDGTAIVEKQTAALVVFPDTIAVPERIEVSETEVFSVQVDKCRNSADLFVGHINRTWFAYTARPALSAFKLKS